MFELSRNFYPKSRKHRIACANKHLYTHMCVSTASGVYCNQLIYSKASCIVIGQSDWILRFSHVARHTDKLRADRLTRLTVSNPMCLECSLKSISQIAMFSKFDETDILIVSLKCFLQKSISKLFRTLRGTACQSDCLFM